MRSTRECPKCLGWTLWNVSPMKEHRADGFDYLGYVDDVEPLETLICQACGYTSWYSEATDRVRESPGRIARIVDDRLFCDECNGQPHYLVAQLQEFPPFPAKVGGIPLAVVRRSQHSAVGRFALLMCSLCGRCDWYAWGLDVSEAEPRFGESCSRCHAVGRHGVCPVREAGGDEIPVALVNERPVGHFEVRFCDACGRCEWYARAIERLVPDGQRIILVKGEGRGRLAPGAGGPYR